MNKVKQMQGGRFLLHFEEFTQELNIRKKLVEDNLLSYVVDAYPPIIHEAMCYAVFNGGKRIRPIMVLEGASLAGLKPEMVMPTACALELIHSYSLVHDDLPAMDNDDMRRGKPTCHIKFGEDIAILTGDALLTLAFELIAGNADIPGIEYKNVVKAITVVAKAAGSQGMIGGQVLDLQSEGKSIDYETLRTLHALKTGELFCASLLAGAILGGMDDARITKLESYARHFGLAFQITDDILDIKGDATLIGKPVGSDEKNDKTTFPRLFGLEKSLELAQDNIEICLENLEEFDDKADFLKNLALFTLQRNS